MAVPWIELAWFVLALIHTPPALATFSPRLRRRMYDVEESPALGVMLTHRGVLFLAVAVSCVFAAVFPDARRLGSLVVLISLAGFLIVYALAGMPKGPLRQIALVDAVGVAPLIAVCADAWMN